MRFNPRQLLTLCVSSASLSMACSDSATVNDPANSEQRSAVGSLELTTTTSGVDTDTDGYQLAAYREGYASVDSARLAPNATVIIHALVPGKYSLALSDVDSNCGVESSDRHVEVIAGQVAKAHIDIRCAVPLQLTYEIGGGWDDDATPREFWTVDSKGQHASQLTSDHTWHENPSWSRDGTRLLYGSDRGKSRMGIWILEPSGDVINVNTGLLEEFDPRWSPDGSRIAFCSFFEGKLELFTVRADGSDLFHVTTGTPGDYSPDWSPDGKMLAFSSKREGKEGLWVANADGSGVTRITSGGDWRPAWSPDGSRIAFQRGSGIYVVNRDGSGLARFATGASGGPAWSPDGSKIAYTGETCDAGGCKQGIFIRGIDGMEYTPLLLAKYEFLTAIVGDVAWRPHL